MLKKMLLLTVVGSLFTGVVTSARAASGKTTSVICSTSSPRAVGFELVRVTRKKDRGVGSYVVIGHKVGSGGVLFQASYDTQLKRLKAKAVQADDDGEAGQFLASIDAVASVGEHVRMIFMNPAGPEKTPQEVELVCNVVSYEP